MYYVTILNIITRIGTFFNFLRYKITFFALVKYYSDEVLYNTYLHVRKMAVFHHESLRNRLIITKFIMTKLIFKLQDYVDIFMPIKTGDDLEGRDRRINNVIT